MRFQLLLTKLLIVFAMTGIATSPTAAQSETMDARVHERFLAAYGDSCDQMLTGEDIAAYEPAIYQLFFRYDYEEKNQLPHEYRLYEYPCFAGAYNFSSVYFSANEYDEIQQVTFAFPDFDVTYKDDEETIIEQITLTGFSAWDTLTNPDFSPKTMTLVSNSRWRGLGDASSSGQWVFLQGKWSLKTYDIDPTYDGEISMIRIFGEGTPPEYD